MRDAAMMIAALGDDYAPSLAARFGRAVIDLVHFARRHWAARRHLKQLRRLDARLLDDIGLAPEDLAVAGVTSPLDVTRRLAARVAARRAEERWTRI